eukprot:TRINITY_DN6738_c1_g1_i1.p1 TRINITY_DN6738_c1_g1~~TRINITY_DN6738_c1_g1_i1.p1  ORF type:complete len:126 (-),score=15.61 TRINITY_DN6738_c1_g1_i1:258-635(-)
MKLDESGEKAIPLKTVYSSFTYNSNTTMHKIVESIFSSRRDIGVLDEEKNLSPSSRLTVIGQALFDKGSQAFVLQRPNDGRPLIVETGMKSKLDIIRAYKSSQGFYFWTSMILFSIATGFAAYFV